MDWLPENRSRIEDAPAEREGPDCYEGASAAGIVAGAKCGHIGSHTSDFPVARPNTQDAYRLVAWPRATDTPHIETAFPPLARLALSDCIGSTEVAELGVRIAFHVGNLQLATIPA